MPGGEGTERADLPQSRFFISFETYLFCCSFGNLINLLSDSWGAAKCVHVVCWVGDEGVGLFSVSHCSRDKFGMFKDLPFRNIKKTCQS